MKRRTTIIELIVLAALVSLAGSGVKSAREISANDMEVYEQRLNMESFSLSEDRVLRKNSSMWDYQRWENDNKDIFK